MTLKEQLYLECQDFLNNRLKTVQEIIANIQESLQSETKSSAGDKHETGRAMLQLEREKAGNQLAEIQKQQLLLAKVSIEKSTELASLGSIVYTTNGTYFIAISKGQISLENNIYFAIPPNSPIGKLLLGKQKGDSFVFNDRNTIIEKIL